MYTNKSLNIYIKIYFWVLINMVNCITKIKKKIMMGNLKETFLLFCSNLCSLNTMKNQQNYYCLLVASYYFAL